MPNKLIDDDEERRKEAMRKAGGVDAQGRSVGTPQEQGQAFIKQREKLAAQKIEQGSSPVGAQREASQQISGQQNQGSQLQQEQTEKGMKKAEGEILQKEAGTTAAPTEAKSLQTEAAPQNLVLGNSLAALGFVGNTFAKQDQLFKEMRTTAASLPPEQQQSFINVRTKEIVDREAFQRAETFDNKFGAFIEAIPGLGKLARAYGLGFTTPGKRVDDTIALFDGVDEQINQAVTTSDNPQTSFQQLAILERRINEYESKIQNLIILSADLRANPEQIDKISFRILGSRQSLFAARQAIASSQASQSLNNQASK